MSITRKFILAFLVSLLGAGQLAAQTGSITGQVVDQATATGVARAAVAVEGMPGVVLTDANGAYSITGVSAGTHNVTVRYIGYGPITQVVTVRAGQTATANFGLRRQAIALEELVVTGYGAQRRVAITGSVATVDADAANVGVVTNANELLQGRVAGVNITQNSGEPGAGVQIRIRGGTSISASNEPLYVIDGVAIQNNATEESGIGIGGGVNDVNSSEQASLSRSPLNLINPADIESITVLKDAAAAAIYGARGANGVVLIETKRGQPERSTFEYDSYVSVASRAKSLDLLSADQYRQFVTEQLGAGAAASLGQANTDWEKEVTRSAITHNHNVTFSGGTESTQYRASMSYMNQEGVTRSSGLERYQARLNGTQYALDDRLQLRLNLTAAHVANDYVPFENRGGFEGGIFQNMVQFNPTQPVMDGTTGEFYEIGAGVQSVRNPVALAEQIADQAGTTRVLGNIRAQLEVTENLSGQLVVGVDRSESTRREYYPTANPVGAQFNGLARQGSRELTAVTAQGIITFSKRFGAAHDVEAVGGYEFNDYQEDRFRAESRDFLTDAFGYDNLAGGGQLVSPFSGRTDNRLIGFFSRVTYGFNDRYFLTGVIRRDGSSRFGADHKWATFPAVSGSWRITEEDFARGGLFSELRLRIGYGVQGNEAVDPYASLLLLAPSDGDSYAFGDAKTVGVAPTRAANPELKWEETSQFNLALDYGFMDNRISGSVEYYIKNTSDLLLSVPVPQPAVQGERLENIGKVRNRGFEAALDALVINKSNVTLQAGLVFSAESNEVVDLGGRSFITTGNVSGQGQSGVTSQRILPGFALGTFYGPEFVGIEGGRQTFNHYDVTRDAEGNITGRTLVPGAITSDQLNADTDFLPIGNASPDFTLGLRSQMTWGMFDASFIARWEQGRDVFNNTALVYGARSNVKQEKNFLASSLNDEDSIDESAVFSSRWIEDGSFFRLQNIVVGYTFESSLIGAGRTARIYVSADNLLLLTGYSGYDPEVHTQFGLASRGIDYLSYPRARTFTAGMRLAL